VPDVSVTHARRFATILAISAALLATAPARADLAGHGATINGLAVSPEGKRLLSASWDYTVRLWDLETQAELKVLDGHTASVNAVVFAPDGKSAFSGSWDQKIIEWDLAAGKERRRLEGHVNSISSLALSKDGKRLA
jgi:WD40 repeat protein